MSTSKTVTKSTSQDRSHLVAYWSVPLIDGTHTVEFEHGTTSGKRVLRIDGKVSYFPTQNKRIIAIFKEIFRKEWMFKLVGDLKFAIGKQQAKCELRVDPIPPFSFSYSLLVDGKPLEKFTKKQQESIKCWNVVENGKRHGVILGEFTQLGFVQ